MGFRTVQRYHLFSVGVIAKVVEGHFRISKHPLGRRERANWNQLDDSMLHDYGDTTARADSLVLPNAFRNDYLVFW